MRIGRLTINVIAAATIMMMAGCGTTKNVVNTTDNPTSTSVEDTEAARLKFVRNVRKKSNLRTCRIH